MIMPKYRIKTLVNANGSIVDESYEAVSRFDLDGGKRTIDINWAYRVLESVQKDCPKGIYEVEEIE